MKDSKPYQHFFILFFLLHSIFSGSCHRRIERYSLSLFWQWLLFHWVDILEVIWSVGLLQDIWTVTCVLILLQSLGEYHLVHRPLGLFKCSFMIESERWDSWVTWYTHTHDFDIYDKYMIYIIYMILSYIAKSPLPRLPFFLTTTCPLSSQLVLGVCSHTFGFWGIKKKNRWEEMARFSFALYFSCDG